MDLYVIKKRLGGAGPFRSLEEHALAARFRCRTFENFDEDPRFMASDLSEARTEGALTQPQLRGWYNKAFSLNLLGAESTLLKKGISRKGVLDQLGWYKDEADRERIN